MLKLFTNEEIKQNCHTENDTVNTEGSERMTLYKLHQKTDTDERNHKRHEKSDKQQKNFLSRSGITVHNELQNFEK